jgi:hypothetical protein
VALPPALDVQRLVEITGAGRVDRDERKLAPLPLANLHRRRGGLALRVEREGAGHASLAADLLEAVAERLGGVDADVAGGH